MSISLLKLFLVVFLLYNQGRIWNDYLKQGGIESKMMGRICVKLPFPLSGISYVLEKFVSILLEYWKVSTF